MLPDGHLHFGLTELMGLAALILTIVGAVSTSHYRIARRFDEARQELRDVRESFHKDVDRTKARLDSISSEIRLSLSLEVKDVKDLHLKPIQEHLAKLNGRVGRMETKQEEHEKLDNTRFGGLEKWMEGLNDDLKAQNKQMSRIEGQRS